MRALLAAAALLALAARLAVAGNETTTATAPAAGTTGDDADDDEGDSAPFMVVVRHADGRVCGAALVSLRTALSSAACARAAPGAELWAVAPAAAPPALPQARRVLRVAFAAGGEADEEGGGVAGDPWAGAAADLALLELAVPLPGARAILMATDPGECAAGARCHVVRAEAPAARLRIVDARLEAGAACAARGPRWPALRARTLCLAGAPLCRADWGTGVVCGGKLCGVLSRSAPPLDAPPAGERCGDVHAAPSVPRWRRFLHCAHTHGACGRDGDCAQLCKERWLEGAASTARAVEGDASPAPPSAAAYRLASTPLATPSRTPLYAGTTRAADAARAAPPATRTEPPAPPPAPPAPPPAPRPVMREFEPNRADFSMSPAGSARELLKAGEYGDSAAEYPAAEEPPAPAGARSAAPPTRSEPPRAAAGPAGPADPAGPAELAARVSPAAAAGPPAAAPPRRAPRALALLPPLCCLLI